MHEITCAADHARKQLVIGAVHLEGGAAGNADVAGINARAGAAQGAWRVTYFERTSRYRGGACITVSVGQRQTACPGFDQGTGGIGRTAADEQGAGRIVDVKGGCATGGDSPTPVNGYIAACVLQGAATNDQIALGIGRGTDITGDTTVLQVA